MKIATQIGLVALVGFCKAVGLHPSQVAVIGDSTHDLEMGHAAGAGLNIAVLSGTAGRDDLAPHADLVLDSIADLPEILRGGA